MSENSRLLLDLLTMIHEIEKNPKVWFSKELDKEIYYWFDRLDPVEVMEELDIDSEHETKVNDMYEEWLEKMRKEYFHDDPDVTSPERLY